MAGVQFLNPYLKVIICLMGLGLMAYLLYPDIHTGRFYHITTIGRVFLFIGFMYFLVKSIKQILQQRSSDQ